MNTTETTKKRPTMHTNCKEIIELLAEIKRSGGKRPLNRLGEWMRSGEQPIASWDSKDLKYILK